MEKQGWGNEEGRSSGKGREWSGEIGRVRLGGGNGEGLGNEKGEMGREQQEVGNG